MILYNRRVSVRKEERKIKYTLVSEFWFIAKRFFEIDCYHYLSRYTQIQRNYQKFESKVHEVLYFLKNESNTLFAKLAPVWEICDRSVSFKRDWKVPIIYQSFILSHFIKSWNDWAKPDISSFITLSKNQFIWKKIMPPTFSINSPTNSFDTHEFVVRKCWEKIRLEDQSVWGCLNRKWTLTPHTSCRVLIDGVAGKFWPRECLSWLHHCLSQCNCFVAIHS